ncbi:PREDICTED: ATP synthase subunit e, mitochondrial [Pygoscelis adeliae]|uniref:ATP synthase subunit e, mitochondrial n=1 Tax=Pygoscelis adeliae TaxID=9238 RepID=UPI0004F4D7F5|nr:PREDICTED: ATP synthase subunit e, mitochondrial [Pygoscelis adeliae]
MAPHSWMTCDHVTENLALDGPNRLANPRARPPFPPSPPQGELPRPCRGGPQGTGLHWCEVTDYLKPIAEEERRVEAEEKKKREELERIAKELAEASEESILK